MTSRWSMDHCLHRVFTHWGAPCIPAVVLLLLAALLASQARGQMPSAPPTAPTVADARSILGQALAAAEAIRREDSKAEVLLAIAAAQVLAGDSAARETFKRALQAVPASI